MISTKPENYLYEFARESNHIEGIWAVSRHEDHAEALKLFLLHDTMSVGALESFVKMIEPEAYLRRDKHDRVTISGVPTIPPEHSETMLIALLDMINENTIDPYTAHVRYEKIHPFMDGNGRSGRALWLWTIHRFTGKLPKLLFLHAWYYKTLDWYKDK